jgi:hypothetical protein
MWRRVRIALADVAAFADFVATLVAALDATDLGAALAEAAFAGFLATAAALDAADFGAAAFRAEAVLVVVLVAVFAIRKFPRNATGLFDSSICIGFQLWVSNPAATVSTAFMGEYSHRMIDCLKVATIDLGARSKRKIHSAPPLPGMVERT